MTGGGVRQLLYTDYYIIVSQKYSMEMGGFRRVYQTQRNYRLRARSSSSNWRA